MTFALIKREGLKELNKLASLQAQAKVFRLQDKLGKQNFHEDIEKVFEPKTKAIQKISGNLTKTLTETSNKNNQAIES